MTTDNLYFLLFGRSRSGTTVTYQILNNHPEIDITNQAKRFNQGIFPTEYPQILGDKSETLTSEYFERYIKIPNFYFIYIIRDGRDCVASGMRMSKIWKNNPRDWKSLNPLINSADWAKKIRHWQSIRKKLSKNRYIELKFEDYLINPDINAKKLAYFLNVDVSKMVASEKKHIKKRKTHCGYYLKYVPDWKNTFDKDAIELLSEYGYFLDHV